MERPRLDAAPSRRVLAPTFSEQGETRVEESFLFGAFVAMQFVRSPHLRAMRTGRLAMMREKIKEMGGDPGKMPEVQVLDGNQEKMLDIRMLRKSSDFIPTI